jgi:hypothetical protein
MDQPVEPVDRTPSLVESEDLLPTLAAEQTPQEPAED